MCRCTRVETVEPAPATSCRPSNTPTPQGSIAELKHAALIRDREGRAVRKMLKEAAWERTFEANALRALVKHIDRFGEYVKDEATGRLSRLKSRAEYTYMQTRGRGRV